MAQIPSQLLGEDELWAAFQQITEGKALLLCSHVCRAWRAAADEPALWRRLCARLWDGRAYVPRRFTESLPGGNVAGWRPYSKAAYFASIRDAERTELTADELCQFTWERVANHALNLDVWSHAELASPAAVCGDVCVFSAAKGKKDRGSMVATEGHPGRGITGGTMKWRISRLWHPQANAFVTCVSNGPPDFREALEADGDGDDSDEDDDYSRYYPPKPVWRTKNWGWIMANDYATYSMIGTTLEVREDITKVLKATLIREYQRYASQMHSLHDDDDSRSETSSSSSFDEGEIWGDHPPSSGDGHDDAHSCT
eukprot:SAG31_NODE_3811_length_3861_cov_3.645401_1_plen_313_part_00